MGASFGADFGPPFLFPREVSKPLSSAVVANILMALPAHAEAGKIFDFNLTLPIMAGQFLLLMVFLDKTWFSAWIPRRCHRC